MTLQKKGGNKLLCLTIPANLPPLCDSQEAGDIVRHFPVWSRENIAVERKHCKVVLLSKHSSLLCKRHHLDSERGAVTVPRDSLKKIVDTAESCRIKLAKNIEVSISRNFVGNSV